MGSATLPRSRTRRLLVLGIGFVCLIGLTGLASRDAAGKAPTDPKARPNRPGVPYEQVRVINEQISAQWKVNGLKPSRPATDYEFIRRVSLDIIGRIATPKEIERFLKDPPHLRRSLLVQRLLDSDDYARNWANIWSVWLMTRSVPAIYQEQMQTWLQSQFSGHRGWDKIAYDLLTAKGKSDENGAVNFILSKEGMDVPPPDQAEQGRYDFVPLTSRTTRLFMGLKVQCCQCHDDPFNGDAQWGKQNVFWGINDFFRQVRADRMPLRINRGVMPSASLKLTDDVSLNPEATVFYEEKKGTLKMTRARFFDGRDFDPKANLSRRQQLARFILGTDWFAKAYVNRMWGHFFGRGFTNPGPVDDFSDQNPVTHPMLSAKLLEKIRALTKPPTEGSPLLDELNALQEDKEHERLLDYLAKQFKQYNYDPRVLILWICNSEPYQLSTVANPTNADEKAEPFFSRMGLKAMSPEQLFESLWVATGAGEGQPAAFKKEMRQRWMRNLVVNFGDDEGNEVTFNGTVVQALMLMNGKDLNEAISSKTRGTLLQALKKRSVEAIARHLCLAALNRPPTAKEMHVIREEVRNVTLGRSRNRSPVALWQDVFWALLNSNEFMLNH